MALLAPGTCHYCGGSLPPTGAGLDRKDNNGPYSLANAVPCCRRCNTIKGNAFTYEEFMEIRHVLIRQRVRIEGAV